MRTVSKAVERLLSVNIPKESKDFQRRVDDSIDKILSINDFRDSGNLKECESAVEILLEKALNWTFRGGLPLFPNIELSDQNPKITTFWRVTSHPDYGLGKFLDGRVYASPSLGIASFFLPFFLTKTRYAEEGLFIPPSYMFLAKYELPPEISRDITYYPMFAPLRDEKGYRLNDIVSMAREENAKNMAHHQKITNEQWVNKGMEVLIPMDFPAERYMIRTVNFDGIQELLASKDGGHPGGLLQLLSYVERCADFEVAKIPDTEKWQQFLGRMAQVREIFWKSEEILGRKITAEGKEAKFFDEVPIDKIEQAMPVAERFAEKHKALLGELQNWEASIQRVSRGEIKLDERSFETAMEHFNGLQRRLGRMEGYSEYRFVEIAKQFAQRFVNPYQGIESFPEALKEIANRREIIRSLEENLACKKKQAVFPDPTEADIIEARRQKINSSQGDGLANSH